MNRRILLLCLLPLLGLSAIAQVTIGSGTPPSKAALLDLKDQEVNAPASVTDDANVTSEIGGLLLPRVKLVNTNTLEPFIDVNDELWVQKETNKIRETHAGLMIYNLSTTAGLEQGIYVWDGAKWVITKTTVPAANNNWSLDGNTGTTTGTNFLGTADAQGLAFKTNNTERIRITSDGNIGISTTAPSASLHVNGDMKLATAPTYSGADVMVRKSDGSVGTAAPEAPINKIMYTQSKTSQIFSSTTLTRLNNGDDIIVTWAAADESNYRNLLTRNADHSFTFNEKVLCEVSGYVNYQPNATIPDSYTTIWNNNIAALNVSIQYALSTTPNNWVDLAGARHIFSLGAMAAAESILVPAAIMTFNKNDKIRMIIKRPSSSFGLTHGTSATNSFIIAPTGSQFSKGFKITTM